MQSDNNMVFVAKTVISFISLGINMYGLLQRTTISRIPRHVESNYINTNNINMLNTSNINMLLYFKFPQ